MCTSTLLIEHHREAITNHLVFASVRISVRRNQCINCSLGKLHLSALRFILFSRQYRDFSGRLPFQREMAHFFAFRPLPEGRENWRSKHAYSFWFFWRFSSLSPSPPSAGGVSHSYIYFKAFSYHCGGGGKRRFSAVPFFFLSHSGIESASHNCFTALRSHPCRVIAHLN